MAAHPTKTPEALATFILHREGQALAHSLDGFEDALVTYQNLILSLLKVGRRD